MTDPDVIPAEEQSGNGDLSIFLYKSEFIKWALTLLLSVTAYSGIFYFIRSIYQPNIQLALDYAHQISHIPFGFAPEPKERLLFISGVLIIPILIGCFYFLINKKLRFKSSTIDFYYYPVLLATLALTGFVAYMGFAAPNPFASNVQNDQDVTGKTNFDFYFIGTFIYKHYYLFAGLIFPSLIFNFLFKYRLPARIFQGLRRTISVSAFGFCAVCIAVILMICAFKFPYSYENKYDFNAVYYATVQVFQGSPMLVDSFTSTYGLYPHFLVPFLKVTGLSVGNFSLIMGILSSLCFVFFLLFLQRTVTNGLLGLFGFTTVFFNSFMYVRIATSYDCNFAMCPIRWILPALLLFYATVYLRNPSRLKYFISLFIFSPGILWNPDFGLFTYLALISFYVYLELGNADLKTILKKTAFHLLFASLALLITFVTYSLILKIFYGSFPDLLLLFSTVKVFSIIGFGMFPMPSDFHPWMLVALVYMTGILYSVHALIAKSHSPRAPLVFLLSALGIASFSYYQGRSHNWNLFASNFEAFLLLTVFADELLPIARKTKSFIIPFSALIFILSFSLFQILYDYQRITDLVFENKNKVANLDAQERINWNAEYVRRFTKEHEKVLIFSVPWEQGLYYGLSNTCAAINPGMIDLFLRSDYDRMLDFITTNEHTKIFFEPALFQYSDGRIPVILSALYNIEPDPENHTLLYLTRKKETLSANFMLRADSNDVLHEMPDKNLPDKLRYATGQKGKITLRKQFSIEVVFRPEDNTESKMTEWATLFSNNSEEKGFRIQQNGKVKTQYYLAILNQAVLCTVEPNKWNYISFDINENIVRVFVNGQLSAVQDIGKPFVNSDEPVFIGNYLGQSCFFFGDIREIRISNSLLDPVEVSASWEKIKAL